MTETHRVSIFYEGFELGQIEVTDVGGLGFHYDARWLDTRGAFPLSVTMPLSNRSYGDAAISPWLANLLPEEGQLLALSRSLGVTATDTLAILQAIGGDTAGAISIDVPSERKNWTYVTLDKFYAAGIDRKQTSALARHFDDLGRRPFLVGEDGVRLSLAGGQKKTTLATLGPDGLPKLGLPGPGDSLAIPMNGAPSTVIIKPDNENLPGIVENEAYCLTLARAIGIDAVEVGILEAGDRTALVVARYDRKRRKDGSTRRLHQEDFAQANGVYPGQKYERGTARGPSLASILRTSRYLPPAEGLKLLDQVIFNILVANTDAHAKNYSLMLSNKRSLAPLYDVSSVLPWPHVNQYFAQDIVGRKRKPGDVDKRHWDAIADEAGFNARGVRLRVRELVDSMIGSRIGATERVASMPGVVREAVEHVAELTENNALRIAGRLRS